MADIFVKHYKLYCLFDFSYSSIFHQGLLSDPILIIEEHAVTKPSIHLFHQVSMNSAKQFLWDLRPHMSKSEQSNFIFLLKFNLPPGGAEWSDYENCRMCITFNFYIIIAPSLIEFYHTVFMEPSSTHVKVWTVKFRIFAKIQSSTRGHYMTWFQ